VVAGPSRSAERELVWLFVGGGGPPVCWSRGNCHSSAVRVLEVALFKTCTRSAPQAIRPQSNGELEFTLPTFPNEFELRSGARSSGSLSRASSLITWMRAPSESPSWRPPGPRDRKHGGVPSAVLGVFAAVYTERAALRALSEHGSAEPDPGRRFRSRFGIRRSHFALVPGRDAARQCSVHRSSPTDHEFRTNRVPSLSNSTRSAVVRCVDSV